MHVKTSATLNTYFYSGFEGIPDPRLRAGGDHVQMAPDKGHRLLTRLRRIAYHEVAPSLYETDVFNTKGATPSNGIWR